MYIADIGNRFAHIFDGKDIKNIETKELFKNYSNKKVCYINVNKKVDDKLNSLKNWVNLEKFISIQNSYSGMGIDRKALLLSRGDGIYIDAGSAITIDKKLNSKFAGGVILPGIWRVKKCYSDISPILKIDTINRVDLNTLPTKDTKNTLSYGIIAPIIFLIKSINKENLPIYCCGGDGELIASYIDGAVYKKDLIFEGLLKVIKENSLC